MAAAAEQRLIDHVAGERADQTPEDGADRPEQGTAGRRAGHCKKECCHDESRTKGRVAAVMRNSRAAAPTRGSIELLALNDI
jgi:hypothetical protein